MSYLLFGWLLHAWTHSDDLLVASFVNHTGTHWEKQQPPEVKLVIWRSRNCDKRQKDKIRSAHPGTGSPAFQKHPYKQRQRDHQIQFTVHTDTCEQWWFVLARFSHQMNSLQWKQKVGWRRKVDMNLCPLTWWILRLTAPCRFLVNCLKAFSFTMASSDRK